MMLKVFAVFDSKAAAFMAPHFVKNAGVALRGFTDAVNQQGSDLNLHPEDYALYELGTMDDATGLLELTKSTRPEVVATGSQCIKVNPHDMRLPGIDVKDFVKS